MTANTKYVGMSAATVDAEDSGNEEFHLYTIGTKPTCPINVKLQVDGRRLVMEVDTGAAVSIISEGTRKKLFTNAKLHE